MGHRGHRMGRGGGQGATGLLRAGGLCHFFIRSRAACAVPSLLWCVLCVLVVWLRHSKGEEPRGALAWLVWWPVPVSGAGAVKPGVLGGGFEVLVPPRSARVADLLRVPSAARPRRSVPPAVDRPVTPGGRRQTSWLRSRLPGRGRVECCLSRSLGRRGNGGDVGPLGVRILGSAPGIGGR